MMIADRQGLILAATSIRPGVVAIGDDDSPRTCVDEGVWIAGAGDELRDAASRLMAAANRVDELLAQRSMEPLPSVEALA